jgi:uncharacterized RmlC-like cupin family protein
MNVVGTATVTLFPFFFQVVMAFLFTSSAFSSSRRTVLGRRRASHLALCMGVALAGAIATPALRAHMVNPSTSQTAADQVIVVPNSGGVTTVRANNPTVTRQQVQIFRGISTATAGSKQLSMNRIVLPPGMKGLRHRHIGSETVIYVLEGQSRTLIGLNGEIVVDNKAGDFILIPPGVWHQPMNITKQNVIAIEARADADDQKNVELAPNQ